MANRSIQETEKRSGRDYYDRWLPDPPEDPRRSVAEETLRLVLRSNLPSSSRGELALWMALSEYPVQEVSTMFSVVLSVDTVPEGYIRDPMVSQGS